AMMKEKRKPVCQTVRTRTVVDSDQELREEDWQAIIRHDAVIAYDDDLANLIGRTAGERGVSVPTDLAIAGFNGDYASMSAWQRLTTVRIPSYEMGRKAAEMAFELVAAGSGAALPSSVHHPTLVVGKTT
ncbi:MAG: hypothetical protein EOP85_06325, partial [Verrucomicrobiaceae bacterium]